MDLKSNDQVAALRLLTEWTGQVTDIQVKTLNAWPLIMIPDLKSHEVQINLDEHKVTYKLKFQANKTLKEFGALAKIEQGVWTLLGDTWLTTFEVGKRTIYAGTRRKEFVNAGINLGKGREGFDPKGTGSVSKVRRKR